MKYLFLIILLLFLSLNIKSQENIITVGFQYKPIFSNHFFNKGVETISPNNVIFSIQPSYGFCAGMSIRRGLTKLISFETGINYVKRKYKLSITNAGFKGESEFSIVGYEIPLLGLVFIRLGEKVFMDVGMGVSLDLFPTDIFTYSNYFKHSSVRNNWIQAGVLANIGFEFRTTNYGYFYLGASYHQPFSDIYKTRVKYEGAMVNDIIDTKLLGNYFTLDFRYFFHADLIKKKKKK